MRAATRPCVLGGGLVLWLATSGVAQAQAAYLVRDIRTDPASSSPDGFVQVGDEAFFSAFRPDVGVELWRTDGTADGTGLVRDIFPGPCSSKPQGMTGFNGSVFFWADDGRVGSEPWSSDGSEAGTLLLKDLRPGGAGSTPGGSSPSRFTAAGGRLFFAADDGAIGNELWRTDGSPGETRLVADIFPGRDSSQSYYLTAVGNNLFFVANDGQAGWEPWRSDGTPEGTVRVKDIDPGARSSGPYLLTAVGGLLYFTAGSRLWRSDGTDQGTTVALYASTDWLTEMRGAIPSLLFVADTIRRELMRTDESGTRMVRDIWPGSGSANPAGLTIAGGRLYFSASDGVRGNELWRSDGTESGTWLVADVRPGAGSSLPARLVAAGAGLFFEADDGVAGRELWRSDGTASGTWLVRDIAPGSADVNLGPSGALGEQLLFSADDGRSGSQLWRSDGTEAGTYPVKRINDTGTKTSDPQDLTAIGTTLYFTAVDGEHGREPWTSDGTGAGTALLRDIRPGAADSFSTPPVRLGSVAYFTADDGVSGRELWRSDGTEAGTRMVRDLCPGTCMGAGGNLSASNGWLYFDGNDGVGGRELWRTDGTEAGTTLVADIEPGSESSNLIELVDVAGMLFFRAGAGGVAELWRSDGRTVEVVTTPRTSLLTRLTPVAGTLFFVTFDGWGWNLWKTDTTDLQALRLALVEHDHRSSGMVDLTAAGGRLFFHILAPTYGDELWRSDGTAAGTGMVKDIDPGSSYPGNLTDVGGTLLFAASNGLWRSDGTEAGTRLVSEAMGRPRQIVGAGSVAFVAADGSTGGAELWRSDGTAAGTRPVANIAPCGDAAIGEMAVAGRRLFFTADDGTSGKELWALAVTPELLRSTAVRRLAPVVPPLDTVLPLTAERDAYLGFFATGDLEPQEDLLGDAGRPLAFYALDGAFDLHLVKTADGRIRFEYGP